MAQVSPADTSRRSNPERGGQEERLRHHVRVLAGDIGERNLWNYAELTAAAAYIEKSWKQAGYAVRDRAYTVRDRKCRNLETEIVGSQHPGEIVLVGAHYDSVIGSPGANDNGSGVAALLEIARQLRGSRPERTVRLVAFVNEEPPFFQTEDMGSRVYARQARAAGENIVAMLSLETLGYYDHKPGSQKYPLSLLGLFYPDAGNFLGFVANLGSGALLYRTLGAFRRHADLPARGLVAPAWVVGVAWSDQFSFWQENYPALMVTDTALFRYPWYHTPDDTPDKLRYPQLAEATAALAATVAELAGAGHFGRGARGE